MLQMVPHDESGQQRPPKALALELKWGTFLDRGDGDAMGIQCDVNGIETTI